MTTPTREQIIYLIRDVKFDVKTTDEAADAILKIFLQQKEKHKKELEIELDLSLCIIEGLRKENSKLKEENKWLECLDNTGGV